MSLRFAVIGAGAGGLCAARHLLQVGIEPVIFEIGSHIGGLWVFDNDSGLSPAYRSLHINSEARVSSFSDFPFPDGTTLYPNHVVMSRYFADYARHYDLDRRIRFNARVTSVRAQSERFAVSTAFGGKEMFDGVVVASGHQSEPRHPEGLENFTGTYHHAHAYRDPAPFADKRVLVIGPGNSGVDIAADLCATTEQTVLSARSPVLIMPRMMFGVPNSRVLMKLERPFLPWRLRIWIRTHLTRIFHGTMEQWGFVTPKGRTHPISHPTLISNIAWGRITVKPGIAAVTERTVRFVDGTAEEFDHIVAATGYTTTMPFLASDLSPVRDSGARLELYRRVAHVDVTGLYFVGFFDVTGGSNIRMMEDQSRYVAALASGEVARPGPAAIQATITDDLAWTRRQFPQAARYGLELDPARYRRQLADDRRRLGKVLH